MTAAVATAAMKMNVDLVHPNVILVVVLESVRDALMDAAGMGSVVDILLQAAGISGQAAAAAAAAWVPRHATAGIARHSRCAVVALVALCEILGDEAISFFPVVWDVVWKTVTPCEIVGNDAVSLVVPPWHSVRGVLLCGWEDVKQRRCAGEREQKVVLEAKDICFDLGGEGLRSAVDLRRSIG